MKKFVFVLLACLLLTACAGGQQDNTLAAETTEPPVVGLYDPDHSVEKATNGAVRAYPLETSDCVGLLQMGDKLVLVGENKLTVLQGDDCHVVAELELKVKYDYISASETGIAYYDEGAKEIVLLNPLLQRSKAYPLPEGLQGVPMICLPAQQAYYCDGQELRALNLQTGISRLIRTFTEEILLLRDVCFDGEVLLCEVSAEEASQMIYLSTENGKTLGEDEYASILETCGDQYFALWNDGPVMQTIVGTRGGEAKCYYEDAIIGETPNEALALNGIVCPWTDQEKGLGLNFYDISSGKKTASVQLGDIPGYVTLLTDSKYVWIVVAEENINYVLYRWDVSLSPVVENTVYTEPLYTFQNPDTEGLAALNKRVEEMNKKYGVRIAIWEDAMKTPGNYTFRPEHQVPAITEQLDQLETVLSQFPEKFLQITVEAGWIRICLVRSIESGEPYVQYWSGGDCYGAIGMYADVTEAFLQCAAYAIDAHVMGNSRDFDTWSSLNPADFTYGQEEKEVYLTGEDQAFVSAEAMENPHEDRSRIIAAAIASGSESLFRSETMQAKLLRVCEGIREAYDLEKSSETYIWEQYLNKSLAYTK